MRRAISARFGLTQDDLESEYNNLFLSSLSSLFFPFFPIDLRLTCVCVVIGTRDNCAEDTYFLRYCYTVDLLWRTGDIVKKISNTLYVAYQLLEPGIGQFREFEPPRVHTRINLWRLFLVHKLTCGKRESVS